MKKVILSSFVISGFFLMSCEKCEDCHYDDETGNEVELGEICGDELEDAEANGYNTGDTIVTLHCEEH